MQIRFTAPVKDILRLKKNRKVSGKLVGGFLKLFEKFFGSSIFVEINGALQQFNLETIEAVNSIRKLQTSGLLSKVNKLEKPADEPHCFLYTFSAPSGTKSAGADFLSENKAIWKAYGELIERELWYYSDRLYSEKSFEASSKKIAGRTLNILSLAGFSMAQKNNLQNLRFDENTKFRWTSVRSLANSKKLLSPLQLFSASYFRKNVNKSPADRKKEPMLRWSVTTGLATGRCLDEAITKGILEIIERDSFMITYLNKLSPPHVDLDDLSRHDDDFRRILKSFARYNLEVYLIEGPTDFPVHVYFAAVIDHTSLGPAISFGASADFDLKTCLMDALSESLIVRITLKDCFRDDFDPKEINRHGRLLYWSKMENLDKLRFLLSGKSKKISLGGKEKLFNADDLKQNKKYFKEKKQILARELKKRNYETYFAELTSKKQASELGARSVYVVVPKLQPMHLDESIPYFGGERLTEIPKKLGYIPATELNKEPHPFP